MNISSFLLAVQGGASQGVLWGLMALGVYITFRVLDVADLTVDGSFALGGCVCATLVAGGWNPYVALLVALLAGALAGWITGFLHTVCEIPAILAGILTQIALYSINLHIMGKSNVPLLKVETMFDQVKAVLPISSNWVTLIVGVAVAAAAVFILYWFFGTEIGSAIRATGDNEYMVRAVGVDTHVMKVIGLTISNALVGLSGALVCQNQGYGDVQMGTGAIVIGLASIVIGEVVFGKRFNFAYVLGSIVAGSMIYRIIIAIVLQLGMPSSDLKLLTAVIVAIALTIPVIRNKMIPNLYHKITGKYPEN